MSLTQTAYTYWKSIASQKEAVGSLFQPITGKISSNLFEINNAQGVQGIFYAAAITKKQIYLDKNSHPAEVYVPQDFCNDVVRSGAVGLDCRIAFPGSASTTQRPADWRD